MTRLPALSLSISPPPVEATPLLPDELLVRAVVVDGSEVAFRALYARHTARLFRIARRMTASELDAEDAIQETWLRAFQRVDRFEWRSSLSTWLAGIAINVAREQLQRAGKWDTVELSDSLQDMGAPPLSPDIERAIAALPSGARAAFILHDIEGFTHEEIAGQLGWVAGTSKTQLFRARRALRVSLGYDRKECNQ
jgi:RNA polymerase sigma-70 factor (ECF subfamily)